MARRIGFYFWFTLCLATTQAPASAPDSTSSSLAIQQNHNPEVVEQSDSTAVTRARVRVIGAPVAVLRSGPGAQHGMVTMVAEGDILVADARSEDWFHVNAADGSSGWLHENLLSTDVDKQKFKFTPDPGRTERQRTFHLVAFLGNYAADREDNGFLYGTRMGYAITPRFSFEVSAGRTQIVRSTFIIEQLFNLRLEEETFDVLYYEAGLTVDVLPGRRITPFVAAGVGTTVLNTRVEPTWSVGIGTRAFMSKRFALRWEIRKHRLEVGNQFTRFTGDNLEFSAGTELMF